MEFSRSCDYADIVKKTNAASSYWVRTDKDTVPGKNLFVYFYVCFDALKKGWLEGCRRIIGLDRYFLKGLCKGKLLVFVGKNANDKMFRIAWEESPYIFFWSPLVFDPETSWFSTTSLTTRLHPWMLL